MVYGILSGNGLCEYYEIEKNPGINLRQGNRKGKFGFLNDASVEQQLVHFKNGKEHHVTFYLPQMHCSSCVWLLEQLHKINPGVISSKVNFLKKEITLRYHSEKTTLEEIANTLQDVGYEPHISLQDIKGFKHNPHQKKRIYKIGLAGFCFGNIMLLSFPEYFSEQTAADAGLIRFFSWINLVLGTAVFFYPASEFFISSWKSLRQKFLNIDAPIALAILITYARSVYEIISGTGEGYLDSMSGIVFFMLIGRYFQDITYDSLSFERDYKSFFPSGITIIQDKGTESTVPVSKVKPGMRLKIHHGEILPADSILFLGNAQIDYSFVSGESAPVKKTIGEIIYAGGKQTSGSIEVEVVKEVAQSYLTKLWNNSAFEESNKKETSFIHSVSTWFTYILFALAGITAIYWYFHNPSLILNSVTAMLIVACPCALLLSATFTNGNILRYMGRNKLYIKNADVVEKIAACNTIVFDKTGTLTEQHQTSVSYHGIELSQEEEAVVKSLVSQSRHPISKSIVQLYPRHKKYLVKHFSEHEGKGIEAIINNQKVKLGSSSFIRANSSLKKNGSVSWLQINDEIKGYYEVSAPLRKKLEETIKKLKPNYRLYVLSGDHNAEQKKLTEIFGHDTPMYFNQQPQDKLQFITKLQKEGKRVIMFGDGLNDAGALKASDVGVSVTDQNNNFTPASDAILNGSSFHLIPELLQYSKKTKKIILGSFIISIVYNIVGLGFAIQGTLKPVIAAILMPASSISIVLFTTGLAWFYSLKIKRHENNSSNR